MFPSMLALFESFACKKPNEMDLKNQSLFFISCDSSLRQPTTVLADVGPGGIVRSDMALVMALPHKALVADAALVLKAAFVRGHVRAQRPLSLKCLAAVLAANLGGRTGRGRRRRRGGSRRTTTKMGRRLVMIRSVFAQQQHIFETVVIVGGA